MRAQQPQLIPLSCLLLRRARMSVGIHRAIVGGQSSPKTSVTLPRG
jgi:hypothetical protein